MLDQAIITQLEGLFKQLEGKITLQYSDSSHEKQQELLELLRQVAQTSERIELQRLEQSRAEPFFSLLHNNKETGISFVGIPGGHEFSSLVLAILNSDKKGRLPDEKIIQRIQSLKGPVKLRTFISLDCHNCPDIVQTLNLMAIYHPEFSHEMVDGSFQLEETQRLSLQGVPSVIAADTLISSGKASLSDLLDRLEKHFGSNANTKESWQPTSHYELVVIGGGPAGASAAIYSARKGIKTAILADRVGGQVRETKGIENLISIPYTEGPALAEQLQAHMGHYPIDLLEHRRVEKIIDNKTHKILEIQTGERIEAQAIIIATGANWRTLNIPGEKEYTGRGVAYCPHCDGPFYKGKDVAVIGGGNSGVEAAIDLAGTSKSVTLIEFMPELKADEVLVKKLRALSNVTIITNARVAELKGNHEKLRSLHYENRSTQSLESLDIDGVFVQIGLLPNSKFVENIVERNQAGEIVVDAKCRTNVPNIYAAGDVTTVPYKQIIISMGEGAKAALSAFEDMMF